MKELDSSFKIEYTKGTGPGGQHKNKTETCVKITHIPTGITENCQDTRYKKQNLKIATKRILSKLNTIIERESNLKENKKRKIQINNGDRSFRRRTYNYKTQIVTDHITGKRASLNDVLNGDLELLWD